jgi:uncharacterized protein (DUF433 family)
MMHGRISLQDMFHPVAISPRVHMLYFPKGDTVMSMQDEQQIERYIELNPHKPWLAEAWLKDYGIAVWALVGHLGAVDGDVDRVAADYEVPRAVVEAALAY